MQGADFDGYARLRRAAPLAITAAGGGASLAEVRALHALGIDVAIGMAVDTGALSLDELRDA